MNFQSFFHDEDGAVTVDWVVLTAFVITLSGLIFTTVQDGANGLATNIAKPLSDYDVKLATDKK